MTQLGERPIGWAEGFPKSDAQLRDRIERALQDEGHALLRGVRVEVRDGRVRLLGRVPSYYAKQLAQTAACSVVPVDSLENEIAVE